MFGKKSKSLVFASSPLSAGGRRSLLAGRKTTPNVSLNSHQEQTEAEAEEESTLELDNNINGPAKCGGGGGGAGQQQGNSSSRSNNNNNNKNGPVLDKKSLSKLRKQLHKMSLDELEIFSSTQDDFVLDCLVDQTHAIKNLHQERDDLKTQVSNLAKFNYAREPEFVRDRTKLREISDEIADLIRLATSRHVEPTVNRLNFVLSKLTNDLSKHEELSESMVQDFLSNKTTYKEFIDQFVEPRKAIYMKRSKMDKLTKETSALASNNVSTMLLFTTNNLRDADSPVPTPRQRKRVSFNK